MAGPEAGGATRTAPSWDRMLTIVLLVLGLWNVTTTVAQSRDLPAFFSTMYQAQGIPGGYSTPQVAQAAGWFVAAANLLCLVLAIGFAVPRLQRGRTAFWIPLVCAGVCVIVTAGLIGGALAADPSFIAYLRRPPG